MRAYERFLQYARVWTTSDEDGAASPSTQRQRDLAAILKQELEALGADTCTADEQGYVYASFGASPGCEQAPAIGFVAHMDTAPAYSGQNVAPILHENYDGGDVRLPKDGMVLSVADYPFLKDLAGQTLITADGSTLLGADDKAGIAEILTACERLLAEGLPHGRVCVAFTPDEEIGRGTAHFSLDAFGADYAYTMDGGDVGGIEYENFNAAAAQVTVTGVSVHPGSAKDILVNALSLAAELDAMLPADERPEHTEGYQGFFFLEALNGTAAQAQAQYIIRDHDAERFAQRKALLVRAAEALQLKYPAAKVRVKLSDSYYNMAQLVEPCMHLIDNARRAWRMAGVEPYTEPIRGGTDGCNLSYMGLPCPNMGTGGFNFHGPYECITAEKMDQAAQAIVNLVGLYAHTNKEEL